MPPLPGIIPPPKKKKLKRRFQKRLQCQDKYLGRTDPQRAHNVDLLSGYDVSRRWYSATQCPSKLVLVGRRATFPSNMLTGDSSYLCWLLQLVHLLPLQKVSWEYPVVECISAAICQKMAANRFAVHRKLTHKGASDQASVWRVGNERLNHEIPW